MPSNELGDRVHNFFAEDNSLQGQHHSQVVEGNWPVLNSNFWVGDQRQDLLNSNTKNYYSQNSDLDRGEGGYPLHVSRGLNFTQSNLRPDYAQSQSISEQPNSNGYDFANQIQHRRQNEANFLALDTECDQRNLMATRGSSIHDLSQEYGSDFQAKASVRSEISVSPVSFDLFGGQQQMSHQQPRMQQTFQRQQSGIHEMEQLQQQLMLSKMQELQRHQQLQQRDLRQQSLINQVPPFAKQSSGSQSSLTNGTLNSSTLQYPWTAELATNWPHRGSPSTQGSPNRLVFPSNLSQTQHLVDVAPQQGDQSLYGVPISASRGLPVNLHSQAMTHRSLMPHLAVSRNSLQCNQDTLSPDQLGVHDESSISSQKFQNENMYGLASRQSPNSGMRNMGSLQQVSTILGNPPHEIPLKPVVAVRPEASHEKPNKQVALPQNEVSLDPTEEKILFGSDDNIWAAFGKVPDMSGEAGHSLNSGGLLNGLPSIQSGSWSALMQSAVAETSSGDIAPQEWSGPIFHSNDDPSANQSSPMNPDISVQGATFAGGNIRVPSAPNSGSCPPFVDANISNPLASNQFGNKFLNEPGQRRQHPIMIERTANAISPPWTPGQSETRLQPNGWNALAPIPHGGDKVLNHHVAEKLPQNFHNSQVRVTQGEVAQGNSLWKSNTDLNSAIELGHVKSTVDNPQATERITNSNDAASLVNSCNAGIREETSPCVQNNYFINKWKNAHPPARSQGGGSPGRLLNQSNEPNHVLESRNSRKNEVARSELEHCDTKENSNDSHRSNLSHHASGGFREGGLSDASDSRSLPTGKQKSASQHSMKVPAPRKFQFHPMGNVDEEVDPPYGLKQPNRVPQAMFQQNAHFSQSKLFGQIPRNSTSIEKGLSSELQRDSRGSDEESSQRNFPSHAPNTSQPFNGPMDTYSSSRVPSSQNMLDLLHKVDQSSDQGAMVHFTPYNASSQLPEAEKDDGFSHLRPSQSVSQGFGLQLGPPSQRSQIPDHPPSSQNVQGTFNSLYSSHAAANMGDKGQQIVPIPSVQETQVEFKINRSASTGHGGRDASVHKLPGSNTPAFSSSIPYSGSHSQNEQMTRMSGKMLMNQHTDSFDGDASLSIQRGATEIISPDTSVSMQQDIIASSGVTTQEQFPNAVQGRVAAATSNLDQNYQPFAMPGVSRQGGSAQMLHNMANSMPTHQHNLGLQYQQMSSHTPESSKPNIVESSSIPTPQGYINYGDDYRLKERVDPPPASANTDTASKTKESLGKSSSINNCLNDSPANFASTKKDIEAFGRSLKPNSISHQSYSHINRKRTLKETEFDSSDRVSKRTRGVDNIIDVHQAVLRAGQQNAVVEDSLGSSTGLEPEDSRLRSFTASADILSRNASQDGNAASQAISGLGPGLSMSSSCGDHTTSVGLEHARVSPQMAPSWFNQYGTFKAGQMMQMHDAHRVTAIGSGEPPATLGNSSSGFGMHNSEGEGTISATDACKIGNIHNTPSSVRSGDICSPQLQINVTDQHMAILTPKKRKSAASEFYPWHKVVSENSQNLWTLSMAEAEWNKAASRLTAKVEDDADLIEDGPPFRRYKRRLILTTHLMQQLLHPAPAAILSGDATTDYEIVAYAVSRLVLGDACTAVSRSNDMDVPSGGLDLSSETYSGRRYAKAIGELMGRARKLENDFLRVDRSTSMVDLRVECQDLEKFSVINRFARFHGRGQTDNAETTSADTTSNTQKPIPQRYVTAIPMPRNIPDSVQCLSL